MLKRWACVLLCGFYCFFASLSVVHAENTVLFAESNSASQSVRDMAVVDDTLYLLTDRLWRFGPGDTQPQQMEALQGTVACFVRGSENISVIMQATGSLAVLDNEMIVEQIALPNWDKLVSEAGSILRIRQAVRIGDQVYLLAWKDDSGESYTLWSFNIAAGTGQILAKANDIIHIHPYKDNLLLTVTHLQEGNSSIVTLDPATGEKISTLYAAAENENLIDAFYDTDKDMVWVVSDDQTWPLTGPNKKGKDPIRLNAQGFLYSAQAEYLPDNRLALRASGSVGIYALDTPAASRTLHVMGGIADEVFAGYNLAHPEAPAVMDDRWLAGSDMVMMDILSGQGSDLYNINISYGLQALADKGYLGDLSASEELITEAQQLYPWAQAALLHNGKLVAFPSAARTSLWAFHTEGFAEIGLDIPRTMNDLLDIIECWEDGIADQNPKYQLFSGQMDRELLAQQILRCYATHYEEPGKPLQLNQPILQQLLARIAKAPLPEKTSSSADSTALINTSATPFGRYHFSQYPPSTIFLPPPSFEEGQIMRIAGNLEVYILNPESPNIDLALQYIEYASEHMEIGTRYLLRPDLSEPVHDPIRLQRIEALMELIAEQQAQLLVASDGDKNMLREIIAENQKSLTSMEASSWLVSEEQLEQYRTIASNITLNQQSQIINYDAREGEFDKTVWGQLTKLLQAYLDGQISLNVALIEMDKKTEMVYLEGS